MVKGMLLLIFLNVVFVWSAQNDLENQNTGIKSPSDTLKRQLSFSAVKIATGKNHCLIVNKDSVLWVSGSNEYGQIGIVEMPFGTNECRQVMTGVVDVAAGDKHSLVLKGDGSVWAAGAKWSFGINDTGCYRSFVKILANSASVAAGTMCSMVIKQDGTLWVTGRNECGLFGIGNNTSLNTFTKVLENVHAVAIGAAHSLVLKNDGTLMGAGTNTIGQLGWKKRDEKYKHLSQNGPYEFVDLMSGVSAIATGTSHSLALKKDGTLWATGWNTYGQLGTGDNKDRDSFQIVLSKVEAVSGGNRYTCVIRTDGILWATGGNGYGEYYSYGILDNRERTMFRRELTDAYKIATFWDSDFRLAIKTDGTVWAMGNGIGDSGGELEKWTQLFHH